MNTLIKLKNSMLLEGFVLGSAKDLVGKCGIYCGACRLYFMKNCKGCSGEEHKCPYSKCVDMLGNSCGECQKFPCEKHYGPMAVYAKLYLDWKRQEITKT